MGEKTGGRITSRPYGKVQRVRGRRKLFGKARQRLFLDHLAATCNVRLAAAAAGVSPQCVYQRRERDADFRARWGAAIEEGYAALELRLLEAAMGGGGDDGDWGHLSDGEARDDGPDPSTAFGGPPPRSGEDLEAEPFDKDLALHLLREHKRGRVAKRESAPALRSASWSEVEGYFIARLKALRVRVEGAKYPSTIGLSADGPPPSAGIPPILTDRQSLEARSAPGKLGEEL